MDRTIAVIISAIAFIAVILVVNKAVNAVVYEIGGRALDGRTGEAITSGNATAIVVETGENASAPIQSGAFDIDLDSALNHTLNKFTIGLVVNDSTKSGYNGMTIGFDNYASQLQSCRRQLWNFGGQAIDAETGGAIGTGTVTVSVDSIEAPKANSTSFSNGDWAISFNPCLIPGRVYTFHFLFSNAGRQSHLFLRQVARP